LARLFKRVFEIDLEHCSNCSGEFKIIAAILERPVIEKILAHLGLEPQPPPKGRARESGQDFAASSAPAVGNTSPQAATATWQNRSPGGAALRVAVEVRGQP